MATTRNGPVRPTDGSTDIGLLANGYSGAWSIEVDQATSGPDRWFLQIEGPSAYFYFEIPSPNVIEEVLRLLSNRAAAVGRSADRDFELVIGTDAHVPVRLRRDAEFDDRFFLVFGLPDTPVIHYTLAGEDVKCVVAALGQVLEDLSDTTVQGPGFGQ